ncbi:hypothetical protein GH714_023953 [Hevea brasiliensis]|uniref:Potassium transporter n=1 Tax=Hevea brasiliensis TaxID=3981 RepID=A0A6A6LAQ0_HEVBR|nr:hypothetical protein GH714_023953 [Hevea brasiliensis]
MSENNIDQSIDIEKSSDQFSKPLSGKKLSWHKLRRNDSLEIESRKFPGHQIHGSKAFSWSVILHLAFQSIGIVYGDIGTSPLYVYSSTFTDGIGHNDDILGVLALILYTITLIPLVKYVLIVLRANDNGDGGTFALYSLVCRYAKVGLIPSQQAEDREVSNFQLELPSKSMKRATKLKSKLENSKFAKFFLLFATMLGTSMVIGDGVLTPCISVMSAVGGIKQATTKMTDNMIVWISVVILICLFMVQRFGTDKVGYAFAPIICVWFAMIGGIGVYNFFKYDPAVIKALNPKYIVDYFKRNKDKAWISLGGIVLAITGTEALFADVGHFTVRSIQISMCTVTYPALLCAYTGQAAFLRKHNDLVSETFYKSIPDPLYWPMFAVAVMASIIASQAMISGTFSIIQQSLSLGCFPRVKIVHTSTKYEGQVYIPEINYLLMIACVAVTLGFRSTTNMAMHMGLLCVCNDSHISLSRIDHAYDLENKHSPFLMTVMFVWNDVYRRKYYYELENKFSPDKLKEIAAETNFSRLPGLAMFYSELVQGIPPIFKHYVANVPALHSVLVFVSIKSLPIGKVPVEERFLFRKVEPMELNVFRCVARYGYTDVRNENEPFERMLIEKLTEFIRDDYCLRQAILSKGETVNDQELDDGQVDENRNTMQEDLEDVDNQLDMIDKAWRAGVVHLIGENDVVAGKGSNIAKRILIDYAYNFLKRNLRQSEKVFDIPQKRMLKVGMTYEL